MIRLNNFTKSNPTRCASIKLLNKISSRFETINKHILKICKDIIHEKINYYESLNCVSNKPNYINIIILDTYYLVDIGRKWMIEHSYVDEIVPYLNTFKESNQAERNNEYSEFIKKSINK